uniref:Tetratricopeptide repeat protein n=1 Tax=Magnetococcus massalia (strain MO-1) TaxID=451514 RepID=A0A1S7LHA3_MAGMO|nr:conserved protein of unknown function [Candidatus Magnetococcus massalia]
MSESVSFYSHELDPTIGQRLIGAMKEPDDAKQIQLLQAVVEAYPATLDGHICLIKALFKAQRLDEAEQAAQRALAEAAGQGRFSHNPADHTPADQQWLVVGSAQRLYLFCLKALGVVNMRQQKLVEAEALLSKLLELDPHDEIGGASYLQLVQSAQQAT